MDATLIRVFSSERGSDFYKIAHEVHKRPLCHPYYLEDFLLILNRSVR